MIKHRPDPTDPPPTAVSVRSGLSDWIECDLLMGDSVAIEFCVDRDMNGWLTMEKTRDV